MGRRNTARLKRLGAELDELDAAIHALVSQDEALAARLSILLSIPGISTITAVSLLALMPELGTLDQRAAASLAGLAPMTRQSGQWRGKSLIAGGRALVRQALYMPALVAARFNPDLTSFYNRLTAAGKPPKVAITAVMRKLNILANALLTDGRIWTPKMA